ncbi:MAG: hypothetical protein RL141_506 [Candidatus Parcubacteria bacterium]|jgi:hypothetical protein
MRNAWIAVKERVHRYLHTIGSRYGLVPPAGHVVQPLPEGFLPHQAVEAVVKRETTADPTYLFLPNVGSVGRRWRVGLWQVEMHHGDTEPVLERGIGKRRRLIQWQPLTRTDVPRGWWRSLIMPNFAITGYAPVGNIETYWHGWSNHAKRHRKKWLASPNATIQPVDVETFIAAYQHGTLDWLTKRMFIWMLRYRDRAHGSRMRYWLAVPSTGQALAGLAILDIPETRTSLHVIAFYTKQARGSSVNYGLIDHWFRDAIASGWRYLDFDAFRGPTDPAQWAGFSRFKGQFGTRYITYLKPLIRIVR